MIIYSLILNTATHTIMAHWKETYYILLHMLLVIIHEYTLQELLVGKPSMAHKTAYIG